MLMTSTLVFFWASWNDSPTIVSLLTVCKSSYDWILPMLYHSVTFVNSAQLRAFYLSHNVDDASANRVLRIRHIWIGNTPTGHGDLQCESLTWPITTIYRILSACTNLRSLYIFGLDQHLWYLLESAIPASLEHLAMGPIHGPFFIKNLTRHPRIKRFTSTRSFMRDDEVQEIVLFPHMRQFRRIIGIDQRNTLEFALEQVPCISKSETLEEMQLVVYGSRQCDVDKVVSEFSAELLDFTDDKRVVIRSCYQSWSDLLHSEFMTEVGAPIGGSVGY